MKKGYFLFLTCLCISFVSCSDNDEVELVDTSFKTLEISSGGDLVTTEPYIKDIANGNKILMNPYSTLYLSGEITYCKRVCNYTFTIQNMGTGTQFEVKGVWTQIVPISSHMTFSDIRSIDLS